MPVIKKLCVGSYKYSGCYQERPLREFVKLSARATNGINHGIGSTCDVCRARNQKMNALEIYKEKTAALERLEASRAADKRRAETWDHNRRAAANDID